MALGTDQGGSVRIPASWTGLVGMKATHGVVPFSGGIPMEASIEYIGPLTNTVADNALYLEVLADAGDGHLPKYTEALEQTVKGLKIAVVKEGFGWESSDSAVDQCVGAAASQFETLGAAVAGNINPRTLVGSGYLGRRCHGWFLANAEVERSRI